MGVRVEMDGNKCLFRSVKMDAFGHFEMVKCCKVWHFGRVEWRQWQSFREFGDLMVVKWYIIC